MRSFRPNYTEIAFFDFDGTLIRKDTFFLFCKYCFNKRKVIYEVSRILHKALIAKILKHELGKIKEELFEKLFAGVNIEEFNSFGKEFSSILDKHIIDETFNIAKQFQAKGIKTFIVSASVSNWIKPWAKRHGFHDVIATEIEIKSNNKLTGSFKTPNCKGMAKVERILQYFPNISDYKVYAFGNDKGDKEMLTMSDHSYRIKRKCRFPLLNSNYYLIRLK